MPSGESAKILVKLRVNIHGIFNVCSAVIVDKDFKDDVKLNQRSEDQLDVSMKNCTIPLDSQINEVCFTFDITSFYIKNNILFIYRYRRLAV